MLDPNLQNYIKSAQQQGQSRETIKQSLVANGWQESVVEEALNAGSTQGTADTPHLSLALDKRKPSVNSHFSLLLALILIISLFILANKVVSDVTQAFGTDITASLIINGLIILPFLLLAFGLHFTLGESNEKYLILSRPYYIIAAWLLVRLLYEVSKYLLDKDTVYGVYVVLILVVAVLTGMVIFVQKYLKS